MVSKSINYSIWDVIDNGSHISTKFEIEIAIPCHAPKPAPRAWQSFHTSSPKTQSGNNTNIHIVIEKLPITKFLFRVVE